jgi:hypothetical protein
VTWHHNLFAHHVNPNVRFQGMVDAYFRNNVIYDWGEGSAYGEFRPGELRGQLSQGRSVQRSEDRQVRRPQR